MAAVPNPQEGEYFIILGADLKLYQKDSTGTVTPVGDGSGIAMADVLAFLIANGVQLGVFADGAAVPTPATGGVLAYSIADNALITKDDRGDVAIAGLTVRDIVDYINENGTPVVVYPDLAAMPIPAGERDKIIGFCTSEDALVIKDHLGATTIIGGGLLMADVISYFQTNGIQVNGNAGVQFGTVMTDFRMVMCRYLQNIGGSNEDALKVEDTLATTIAYLKSKIIAEGGRVYVQNNIEPGFVDFYDPATVFRMDIRTDTAIGFSSDANLLRIETRTVNGSVVNVLTYQGVVSTGTQLAEDFNVKALSTSRLLFNNSEAIPDPIFLRRMNICKGGFEGVGNVVFDVSHLLPIARETSGTADDTYATEFALFNSTNGALMIDFKPQFKLPDGLGGYIDLVMQDVLGTPVIPEVTSGQTLYGRIIKYAALPYIEFNIVT